MGMSEDSNENKLPEDDEGSSNVVEPGEVAAEVEEVELEPVGADEGPGDGAVAAGGGVSDLLGKGKLSEKDDRTFGMLAHLLGALTSFVGPLVIWLIKKEESPFVDDQGKESLNFQITVGIGYVAATVLGMVPVVGCVTVMLIPAIWIGGMVFSILACLKANEGVRYRYPFALRLIK
jgi:uncharacterized Tic20 family protein